MNAGINLLQRSERITLILSFELGIPEDPFTSKRNPSGEYRAAKEFVVISDHVMHSLNMQSRF
jgi:hypothetical protein